MDKARIAFASIALACVFLTGCSQETVDSRQIDDSSGLAYKRGSTEPFTGKVLFKDTIPTDLQNYWSNNAAAARGVPSVTPNLSGCEEHFTKGVVDGDASCIGTGGQTALLLHYADEQFDGSSKLYNLDSGALIREQTWSKGKLDGLVKIYTYDGKQLITQMTFRGGIADGAVKQWNSQGKLMTDGVYKSGQIDSGTFGTDDGSSNSSMHYHDGKPNGPFISARDQGDILQKGVFVDGQRDGEWEDRTAGAKAIYVQVYDAWMQAQGGIVLPMSEPPRINSQWTLGKLDGEAKAWDEYGKLIFDLHFSDGILDGTSVVANNSTGVMKTFGFKAGQLVLGPEPATSVAAPSRALQETSAGQPNATASINSPAEALAGSAQIPSTGNACLDDWETAYRKERGDDAIIAYDQIDEWTDECKQGKTAPKN